MNGTTPGPLPRPPMLTGAVDSDTPDQLRDTDGGRWQVTTESTTQYLLDMDRRRIIRHPGRPAGLPTTAFGSNGNTPARPPVNDLDHDGEWTTLSGLIQCRVGRSLITLDQRPSGGGYRISTAITHIQRLTDEPRGQQAPELDSSGHADSQRDSEGD